MARRTKLAVGIEIGFTAMKLVALDEEHACIELVALSEMQPEWRQSPEALGRALADWFKELRLEKSMGPIVSSVPGPQAAVRVLPLVDPADFEAQVRFELRTWLGGDEKNHAIHALPAGPQGAARSGALVVAVPRRLVGWMRDAFQAAGRSLASLSIDALGCSNAFWANYPNWSDRLAAVVHAEGRFAQVLWLHERSIVGYDVVGTPEDLPPVDHLALEVVSTLQQGRGLLRGTAEECTGVLLAGDLSRETGFATKIGTSIQPTVVSLDAFKNVPFPSAGSMTAQLPETSPRCAVAVGLAFSVPQGAST